MAPVTDGREAGSDERLAVIAGAILNTASDAILATDREGVITFWNPGAVRIFGFAVEAAVGQSLDIIIPENLRKRHWDGWAHVMATGQSRYGLGQTLAVPALTADGHRISVEFSITVMHGADGRISGMAAILRDVTQQFAELRKLRQQLAARQPASQASE